MKRRLSEIVVIALLIAAAIGVLHASGYLHRLETAGARLFTPHGSVARGVPSKWQYLFIGLAALSVTWLTLTSSRRGRIGLLTIALIAELVGIAWICSLYRVSFQPIPTICALALGFLVPSGYAALTDRTRSRTARAFFRERLSKDQVHRLVAGDIPFEPAAKTYQATVVVCDVANKYDLAEECAPDVFARMTERFISRATDAFLKAGAYIQAADGEGVVALFGFPDPDAHHGDKAVRVSLDLLNRFRDFRQNNGEASMKCDVHLGISSGTVIVAPFQDGERSGLLSSGEPVELARRFCVANRFYGSHVLIGPRTFELASRYIVARPIDFLSGVNSRERHEIYEPLWLASEAKPEQLARRDSFWNGVVFYREKRWAEAYFEFQKARGPADEQEDAPLQLYLRRLEPLALHLTTESQGV
jgi:class 3 adenylate cyclase